ncbi:type I restriction-modification system subunit M [Puniceicoccales bacterium CK1056]|uniref:site-specific DNA-methyltransferase (adenine-specific) n=1 Tax=Oceanipulchritudo coccoides TaxID=2706888 RepID=A0A6B2LXR3_9BACT|nr:type I restriction-modification system subunit M [Oceanipulchritudo coccoides]NDV61083.1 type I restriction-modification system subunit M [Oceanipulchritudo coccoides]
MNDQQTKDEIFNVIWSACDTFRGVIDPGFYKDYILTLLFVKYLSDVRKSKLEEYEKKYKGDQTRIDRAMSRERFVVPEDCTFEHLYAHRDDSEIGQHINTVLEKIEDANKAKLHNVFRNIDFNSEANLGKTRQRNQRLKTVLEDFANKKLDLRPERVGHMDIVGDVYEYLIARFAAQAGKKAGEFYTPSEVSETLARLVAPEDGDRICDPTCGSGSLLIKAAQQVGARNFSLYGQEMNGSTWALCKMNMFLHEVDAARIEWEDTIRHPQLVENDALMKFDVVVANPPFSLDKWGQEIAATDQYNRFHAGVPPKSKGDWAFISHMVATAVEGKGRVGVVVPHGVLFRGGQEGKIRQYMIEQNTLAGVVGLPANLFYGAGIPAALMIFDKGRTPGAKEDVFFIDASREFAQGTNQNRLRKEDMDKIVETFHNRTVIDKYSHLASFEEIEENDFNLNIPRYVDTFEPEPEIDMEEVQKDIERINSELAEVEAKMDGYLKELGFKS